MKRMVEDFNSEHDRLHVNGTKSLLDSYLSCLGDSVWKEIGDEGKSLPRHHHNLALGTTSKAIDPVVLA